MQTFQTTIDQLAAFPQPVKLLSLTGQGEPLVNPLLPQMVSYARSRGGAQRIEFMSNGALLTHETSLALLEAGIDCIRISLQGLSTEKYAQVCGVAVDFDRLVEQLRFFYAHRGKAQLFVKILDVALERGEADRFYQMFGPIADRVFIEQCQPVYDGVTSTAHLSTETDRYGRSHAPRKVCPLCFYMLGVFPNGDVYPCETIYRPLLLGNVNQSTLHELWNGEALRAFRIQQLQGGRDALRGCRGCCAPDDVAHPEDNLDGCEQSLLKRLGG